MAFWNEAFYFERRGDRYIYRPTIFSAGFDVSADEKEELFRGLKRQSWQISLAALVLAGCIAGALMTGLIETNAKVQWFQISSILMVAVLAVIAIHGRDRLASRILGNRSPDVPRLPIRQALTRSRRPIGKQYAVPVLWSAAILLGLAMGTVDATIVYLVFAVAKDVAAVRGFWLLVGIFNAIMLATFVFAIHQARLVSKSET
jgi:MFS family permease